MTIRNILDTIAPGETKIKIANWNHTKFIFLEWALDCPEEIIDEEVYRITAPEKGVVELEIKEDL